FETPPDDSGLFRVYPTRPTLLPCNNTLKRVTDTPTLAGGDRTTSRITEGLLSNEISNDDLYLAFSNPTASLLMAYQYSGTSQQSVAELQ
ncbi:uncharacterized protein EDB93DRAFT_1095498, partial [Suillus bovinus]|uniref:uncharacterized protein n=1 Tax=Suillus bovinus TaxID=48563 RepID=UPI001B873593